MKKILISLLLILASFTISFNVNAQGSTGYGELGSMLFWEGHTGLLIRHSNMQDPDECGRSDWFILSDTYPFFEEVYALLFARIAKDSTRYIRIQLN